MTQGLLLRGVRGEWKGNEGEGMKEKRREGEGGIKDGN